MDITITAILILVTAITVGLVVFLLMRSTKTLPPQARVGDHDERDGSGNDHDSGNHSDGQQPKRDGIAKKVDVPAVTTLKANHSKTAQLSALRERLAVATGGSKPPPQQKTAQPKANGIGTNNTSWSPKDAGLDEGFLVDPSWGNGSEKTTNTDKSTGDSKQKTHTPANYDNGSDGADAGNDISVDDLLPLLSEPGQKPSASSGEAGGRAETSHQISHAGPIKVLLVDDSKVVRIKTEKLLVNAGFEVCCAVDGMDALDKQQTFTADVIITDIEMPNLDGFGLVRAIRGDQDYEDIPIIVMTSHVNLHLDIAATEGINGFLPKPFDDKDMIDQVTFLTES